MTITTLRAEHVRSVADLHVASLTGLLTALGAPAARAYYAGCAESPLSTAFVAMDGNAVRGFVAGSQWPRLLKREVLARKPLAVVAAVAIGVVRRPTVLPLVRESFRGPAPDSYDPGVAELTYLSVAPELRRGGIGRQLVDAFSAAMRKRGAPLYELSVDDNNHAAASFYESLGFERVGRYREFGIDHRRYRLNIEKAAL
ncbi:MAG: GNAT family N-acetyltransferase [Gemmatimonadota bacterium]